MTLFTLKCPECGNKLKVLSYQDKGTHVSLQDKMYCIRCNKTVDVKIRMTVEASS